MTKRSGLSKLLALGAIAGSALTAYPGMGSGGYGPGATVGMNGKPKCLDVGKDRAPGMKLFVVDGIEVWAGSLKAAVKRARLVKLQSRRQ